MLPIQQSPVQLNYDTELKILHAQVHMSNCFNFQVKNQNHYWLHEHLRKYDCLSEALGGLEFPNYSHYCGVFQL